MTKNDFDLDLEVTSLGGIGTDGPLTDAYDSYCRCYTQNTQTCTPPPTQPSC